MKIKEKTNVERNVRYFCVDAVPRYWEDADINGEEDISWDEQCEGAQPRMPLAVLNDDPRAHKDEKYKIVFKIDLETGEIPEWPKGNKAAIHYKVCDQGKYWLETEDGERVHEIESYCPHILEVGDSYPDGDYFIFNINEKGEIIQWPGPLIVQGLVDKFLSDEGF